MESNRNMKKRKTKQQQQQQNNKKNNKRGVPLWGLNACTSEPKLGNVTTGLPGYSLNYVANLTVPAYMHMTCSFY